MKKDEKKAPARKNRRAMTPEAREDQLISLAIDRAEEMLVNGTAPTSVIVHYLKLGTTKELLEKEILSAQKKLIVAKTEAIEATKDMGEMYKKAMEAMSSYNGDSSNEEDV